MGAHLNTWEECHRHQSWDMKDMWWSLHGGVREIDWGCWWMHRQVDMTLLHMCEGFSHLNEEADNSDIFGDVTDILLL